MFDKFQRCVLDNYADGHFSQVQNMEQLENCGDSLAVFLARELSTGNDCESTDEALKRCDTIINEVQLVKEGFEYL
jgi:hypothetical protein